MNSPLSSIRVGTGAGFSDDRIEPAVELAERGGVNYLVFECLAGGRIPRGAPVASASRTTSAPR